MRSKTVDSNYTGRQISPEPNQRNSYYVLIYKEREKKKSGLFLHLAPEFVQQSSRNCASTKTNNPRGLFLQKETLGNDLLPQEQ